MAFDPDAYLAKKSTFDPDAYLAKSETPSEDNGIDWTSEPSIMMGAAKTGLKGLQYLGEKLDTYSGAPTRAGLLAAVKSDQGDLVGAGKNAWEAAKNQFGEDPKIAPTGEDILKEAGVPENYNMMIGPGQTIDIPIRKIGGFATDVAADPLNFVPVSKIAGVGKLAGALEKAPEALKVFSEGKALSQAGGMLKDFRKLMGKGRVADVGQTILRETVDIADEAGKIRKVPLLSAGDNVESIAEKSGLLKQQTGEKIGQIYKDIDNKVTDIDFLRTLPSEDFKKIATAERFEPKKAAGELSEMINEKYGKKIDGQKVVARANEILDQVAKRGNSLEDALALKGEMDDMVNYAKQTQELPEIQKALVDMRNYIRDKTNNYVESVADILDVKNGSELKKLNKLYGNASEVASISKDKTARNAANRMVSPSDYGSGIGGAVVGTIGGGPLGGVLLGAASGAANKVARERGSGILARGADTLSRIGNKTNAVPAGLLRSLEASDKPVVRGLIKKLKDEEDDQ